MKTEPTLIPPAGAAPATALSSLERALAKCLDEAADAFAASKGPPPTLDEDGFEQDDGRGAQFGRAMALMKMTTKLADAMAKLNSHRSQTHFVHRTEVRALKSPPEPALIASAPPKRGESIAPSHYDDPCPVNFYDAKGNRREITPEEDERFTQWCIRQEARIAREHAVKEAEEGTPSPNSSGSNSENGPRISFP